MKRRILPSMRAAAAYCAVGPTGAASAFGALGGSNPLDESTLLRLARASSLSYLALERMVDSPYYEACGLEPVAQVVDPTSESGATIFVPDPRGGGEGEPRGGPMVVVACRGSANPRNFGTNLRFDLVPATRLSQSSIPDDAMVHEGFQDASLGLWKALSRPLAERLWLWADGADAGAAPLPAVVFTGHSLGGATALLCATHFRTSFGGVPSPMIVTFGGPRLCNSSLARHLRYEALEGSDILHVVHSRDPVLANNRKLWDSLGFENVGTELECDPYRGEVRVGGAGGGTSLFGNVAWNILDHCRYMGVFMGPRLLF